MADQHGQCQSMPLKGKQYVNSTKRESILPHTTKVAQVNSPKWVNFTVLRLCIVDDEDERSRRHRL